MRRITWLPADCIGGSERIGSPNRLRRRRGCFRRDRPMQLGFVGTGTMGSLMAGCLIDAGHRLTVFDVRPEATAALCERGALSVASPCEVARCSEVVFTSLPGPQQVEPAVLDPATGIL